MKKYVKPELSKEYFETADSILLTASSTLNSDNVGTGETTIPPLADENVFGANTVTDLISQ